MTCSAQVVERDAPVAGTGTRGRTRLFPPQRTRLPTLNTRCSAFIPAPFERIVGAAETAMAGGRVVPAT
jgi:hypothetical protein